MWWRKTVKRTLDIVLSSVALVILLPAMVLIALAIRRRPFYSQVRVGLNRRKFSLPCPVERRANSGHGRPFTMYKFRSMIVNAEQDSGPVWSTEDDSRVTRIGRFLRRTHLDELPQFWNVLRGEMSIVGPRPERPEIFAKLSSEIPWYRYRMKVRPGITGLAQVKYRYDKDKDTVKTKLLYDLHYIRNTGLLFDVKIMAATVGVMAKALFGGST